jgi:hypothetical protein
MPPFFQVKDGSSDWRRQIDRAKRDYHRSTSRAARYATDRAAKEGRAHLAERMRQVGLGRLGGAIGYTSELKGGRTGKLGPYGVIFAKGQSKPDDRGAGAIEAYTRGTTITARNGTWLAIATDAVRKRRRLTPDLYTKSALGLYLGPLTFRPIGNGRAVLVAKKVTLSAKTGRALPAGKRPSKTRVNAKEVVVFVLIRFTIRAQRLNEKQELFPFAKMVPDHMNEYFARTQS